MPVADIAVALTSAAALAGVGWFFVGPHRAPVAPAEGDHEPGVTRVPEGARGAGPYRDRPGVWLPVTATTAAADRQVEGITYHLRSAHCATAFDANPYHDRVPATRRAP